MDEFAGYGLYGEGFKCFGEGRHGFDDIKRLNLVIGRNNSGKSALLDLVRFALNRFPLQPFAHRGKLVPQVWLKAPITQDLLNRHFPGNVSPPNVGRLSTYGSSFLGEPIFLGLQDGPKGVKKWDLEKEWNSRTRPYFDRLAGEIENPFKGKTLAALSAERDIAGEVRDGNSWLLRENGYGATNIIQRVINDADVQHSLVRRHLLDDVNRIMGPDAQFSDIAVQIVEGDLWSVFLDEVDKGRISLSDSGSGLKTILLIAIQMRLLARLDDTPTPAIFAFEEPENNLHPGLQRRLFSYIYDRLVETDTIAFVTTHSPVLIDQCSRIDDAQITYISHDGTGACVASLTDTGSRYVMLDDLGMRASDLLQANGVVWVEGPSDVVYLRKWIELYCDANSEEPPVEGSEFSYMFYGGKCLRRFGFDGPGPSKDGDQSILIEVLPLSRNAFVMMDSDKVRSTPRLNATKQRVVEQAEHSWVTRGREIENYVHPQVATEVFGRELTMYLQATEVYKAHKGVRSVDKVKVAERATDLMTAESLDHLDLTDRVAELVNVIRMWNK